MVLTSVSNSVTVMTGVHRPVQSNDTSAGPPRVYGIQWGHLGPCEPSRSEDLNKGDAKLENAPTELRGVESRPLFPWSKDAQ
jgi:hypothetical protein